MNHMQIFDPVTWQVARVRHLVIADGRVNCPVRGSVDVETCFACRTFVTIMGDGEPAYVRCRPVVHAGRSAGD